MFYCDPCAEQRKWPYSLFRSKGKCETCGQVSVCNDTPSKDLPAPARPMVSGLGTWHSTGYRAEDGHAKEDCPGALCPVIEAGYDTLDEPDTVERRPHGFDAALFAAYRGGVVAERIAQGARSPQASREGLTLDEVRESFEKWRGQFGGA